MVEDIGNLSKNIYDYGPFAVLLAMIIVIFVGIIVYLIKQNKKYQEDNETRYNELFKLLKDKDKEADYDEKDIVNIFTNLCKALTGICNDTLQKSGSNRTAIYTFHNGNHTSHGLPFAKMTCYGEKISKDSQTNRLIVEHNSMPLTLFDSIVIGLQEKAEYRINIKETNNPVDFMFIRNSQLQECFFYPIYDSEEKMMGFGFNGYNTIDPNRDINKEKEYLRELALQAKPVLEYSKNTIKTNKEEE